MATWTTIPASLVVAGKPVTASLMAALRENPEAAIEGAPGAPRLQLAAITELVAGNTVRALSAGTFTVTAATQNLGGFFFQQRGTIRLRFQHRKITGTGNADATAYLIRAGSRIDLFTWSTASGTLVSRSLDVTVRPGDFLGLENIGGGASAQAELVTPSLSTSGGDLWPSSGSWFVDGNSV